MIEYDPDKTPEVPEEMVAEGRAKGMHAIQVFCDEPEAQEGDPTGVTFFALAAFLPRPGEFIYLEDKRICLVQKVLFQVACKRNAAGKAKSIWLQPVILADLHYGPLG